MKDKKNTNIVRINKMVYLLVFLLFMFFIVWLSYITLVNYKVGDTDIETFIANRNINEEIIMPDRGSIYDRNGSILAQDVSSYTVIAYLDPNRSEDGKELRHVKDKEGTAKALEPLINMSYDRILELLNKDLYQVELGPGGRNLSQLEMEAIKELNLPGIDFIKSSKRYYPNGDFASYLLGYTKDKEDEDGNVWKVGELGIEGYYNKELSGTSGYVKYEKDLRGYKIANSNEYKVDAVNGSDIYLTIDNTIQLFVEEAFKEAYAGSEAKKGIMVVADAKSGEILGYTSSPSFNPNERNMTSYLDPLVSYVYEPGSTMKIFSYLCAITSGKYNGSDTYLSGSKTYVSAKNPNDTTTIRDWNRIGWGNITYDFGFAMSSNIAVANILESFITKEDLRTCYKNYGFGSKTGITLNGELAGSVKFTYDVEAATAGYGQGITITPIQMIRALTMIANDGAMLSPYVVKEIKNEDNTSTVFERKEIGNYASHEDIVKIKELMKSVILPDASIATGSGYYMEGYDLIGKTGTASIFDMQKGKYLDDENQFVYSFAGLYPKDDPEIIIYLVLERPTLSTTYMAPAVKKVVANVSKYLNIDESVSNDEKIIVKDYTNKVTTNVVSELNNKGIKVITLGVGNKIVDQYPKKDTILYSNDLVVLLTNNYDKKMIDFNGLSYKEVISILKLMSVDYSVEGFGYAYEQNILPGEIINDKVIIKMKERYN